VPTAQRPGGSRVGSQDTKTSPIQQQRGAGRCSGADRPPPLGAGALLEGPDDEPDAPQGRAAIAAEIGRPVDYRPVEADGAARAASLLAELL
jgi:hypothetical protein